MPQLVYRYTFAESVPAEEVEVTIVLAIIATEALHGAAQARLDAAHAFDAAARTVAIDAATQVGRDLNKLFAGFMAREFGPDSFTAERVERTRRRNPRPEPVTA